MIQRTAVTTVEDIIHTPSTGSFVNYAKIMITKIVTIHILRCTEVYKLEDRYEVM